MIFVVHALRCRPKKHLSRISLILGGLRQVSEMSLWDMGCETWILGFIIYRVMLGGDSGG